MLFTSTMTKDNKWRMMSEQGGELSLKHTLVTRSMKKALQHFLNWACWLTRTLQKCPGQLNCKVACMFFLRLTDLTASEGTLWKSSLTGCMQKGQDI